MLERLRERPEPVAYAGGDLVDVGLAAGFGELLVDADFLRDLRDVIARNKGADLYIDHGLAPLFDAGPRAAPGGDRFGQHFAVRFEAHRRDESGLRRAQQIAGAANLEVAHRDL